MFGPTSIHEFNLNSIEGAPVHLTAYHGKVAMVVNVASQCGYTPQYEGLEALYTRFKDKGFVILGVPANNFGGQEPGTNEEIKNVLHTQLQSGFPHVRQSFRQGRRHSAFV